MSEEFAKHHEKLSSAELKTMTTELKKSKKKLVDSLKGSAPNEYDENLVSSILAYINNIKKSTQHTTIETTRKTQKMNFLEALSDFQTLLKTLKKHAKITPKLPQTKLRKKSVVKIQSVKGKTLSHSKELDRQLSLTQSKLHDFKSVLQSGQLNNDDIYFQDVTDLLKKTNMYLTKAKAMQNSLRGKARLDYNASTFKNLSKHIRELQALQHSEFQTGTALTKANLFWYTLREFNTLITELEKLKKIRGKVVAHVETDLLS